MKFNFKAHRDLEPFKNIQNHIKTMEIRLNDEKRQKIKLGDIGKLINRDNPEEYLYIKVLGLSRFSSFSNLYKVLNDKIKQYEKDLIARVYSKEKENKYGVLVIHFELLKE